MRWRESAVLPMPLIPNIAAMLQFSWTMDFSRVASSDVREAKLSPSGESDKDEI